MLTENEISRLRKAIIATIASPIIGSIEDYAWEAIFHYVKDISLLAQSKVFMMLLIWQLRQDGR